MKPNEKLVSNVEIALSENEEMQQLINSKIETYQKQVKGMRGRLNDEYSHAAQCIVSYSLVIIELEEIRNHLECSHGALCDLLVKSGVKE